jgi:hypothetical protein
MDDHEMTWCCQCTNLSASDVPFSKEVAHVLLLTAILLQVTLCTSGCRGRSECSLSQLLNTINTVLINTMGSHHASVPVS